MFLSNNTQIIYPGNGAECKECAAPLYGMRRKYCSTKCTDKYRNQLKPKYQKLSSINAPRSCVHCTVEFYKSDSGLLNYCSTHCQKQKQYSNNKDPHSTYGSGKRKQVLDGKYQKWCQCSYSEAVIDNDVLNHIEYLCTDEPFIEEDMEYIERVMKEEYIPPVYSNGTPYKRDAISMEMRKKNLYWCKDPMRTRFRFKSANSWKRKPYKVLKQRLVKQKYGERKKFMASIKNKSLRNTPTKN